MNKQVFERQSLGVIESLTVARMPLRLLESPWQRHELITLSEASLANLAGRAAGWLANTEGSRLRALEKHNERAERWRSALANAPEHQRQAAEKTLSDRAAGLADKLQHGRISRLARAAGRGWHGRDDYEPTVPGGGSHPAVPPASHAPAPETSHVPEAPAHPAPPATGHAPAAPTAPTARPVVPPPAAPAGRVVTPLGNPAHPQGAANRAALHHDTRPAPEKPLEKLDTSKPPADPAAELAKAKAHATAQAPVFAGGSLERLKQKASSAKPKPELPAEPQNPSQLGGRVTKAATKLRAKNKDIAAKGKAAADTVHKLFSTEKGKKVIDLGHAQSMKGRVLTKSKSLSPQQRYAIGGVYRGAGKRGISRTATAQAIRAARRANV